MGLSTLNSIRNTIESNDEFASTDLKPLCTKKRAPGDWSSQWVIENSWPSRYRLGMRGPAAEQSISQPPQASCQPSAVDKDVEEAGGRSRPLTPEAIALEAGGVSNDDKGSKE